MSRSGQKGVTFVEVIMSIAITAILLTIAVQSVSFYQRHELRSASKQLLGELQRVRFNAMTKRTPDNAGPPLIRSHGFGFQFVGTAPQYTGYQMFEFNDCNNNYQYDVAGCSGGAERLVLVGGFNFPPSVFVSLNGAAPGDTDLILYDELGLPRASTWALGGRTYLLAHAHLDGGAPSRCVVISTTRIREGGWNGARCL